MRAAWSDTDEPVGRLPKVGELRGLQCALAGARDDLLVALRH